MKIEIPDKTGLISGFSSIGLLFFLSLFFRFAMLRSISDMPHLYLAIHGSLKEIAIPFSLLAVAAYFNSDCIKRLAQWSTLFFLLLICCDVFNVYYIGVRISRELLYSGILAGWPIKQRAILGGCLGTAYLVFSYLNKSGLNRFNCQKRNKILASASIALLSVSSFNPAFSHNTELMTWESYYKMLFNHKRVQITMTSFECFFSFSTSELQMPPEDIFWQSPYSSSYEKSFSEYAIQKRESASSRPPELWLHMQNSAIQALKAFSNGFTGIETDLHFDETGNSFLVCHDWPENAEKKASTEKLNQFLSSVEPFLKENRKIWFDIKNLDFLNIYPAIECLKQSQILNKYTRQIWLEFPNPFITREISKAGFQTIQSFFYGNLNAKITRDMLPNIKSYITFSKAEMISLPWQVFNADTHRHLEFFPIALYTFKKKEEINNYSGLDSIRIFLTDETDRTALDEQR